MDVKIRRLRPGEEERFVRSVFVPFLEPSTGEPDSEADIQDWAESTEADRAWVAEEGDRFVANCAINTMDLTVPAPPGRDCPVLPMAGVTAVGVHPTHRRRGLLRQMMAEMLDDARRRSEPVAGLLASESVIYGRFGFGHATDGHELSIDRRRAFFVRPGAIPPALRLIEREEAGKVLPSLHDRLRRRRPGDPNRAGSKWESILRDRPHRRPRGAVGAFTAVCDDGYVRYRAFEGDTYGVMVEDLYGADPEVEAGLWRFVLELDLVDEVRARRRPVDEALRWRLGDPRQLKVRHAEDMLWLRVLDVPAALEARGYRRPGRLVLDLRPPAEATSGERDPAVGRWVLEAGPDGAACRRAHSGEAADLTMEITDLGSLYLGGFRPSALAAGGRVTELRAGSLDLADGLFGAPLAPQTGTGF